MNRPEKTRRLADRARIVRRTAATAVVALIMNGAAAQVQVDFAPDTLNLNIGETALVAIDVTAVPAGGLAAFQLDLTFTPIPIDVLNPNEAFRGTVAPFAPLGGDAVCTTVRGTGTCEDPVWFLDSTGRTPVGTDNIDNSNGVVQIVYGTHGVAAPPSGNGTIALIEVSGEWNGTVVVDLADVILADGQPQPGTFATSLGSLTVVVGTGIANLPPVLSPIAPQQVYEELLLSVPLASNDPDGNAITLSAVGLPAFCGLLDNGDGSGSLDCAPVAGDAGVYPVTVVSTDDGGPNLSDQQTFDLTIDPTNCVDLDDDGFGSPADVSCARGAQFDCDDTNATINPDAIELCRNALDDDCNGATDALDAPCPAAVCLTIVLGAPASDPDIDFVAASACPVPVSLVRSVDVIWGDLAALRVDGPNIKLGVVNPIACADLNDVQAFDNLRPDPGQVDFFLAREAGQPSYGSSAGALPRSPDSGDCP